jgi:hypothetical protein
MLADKAEAIAYTFVRSYYRDLVEADTALLTRYYNDHSRLSFAAVACDRANDVVVGRNKIGDFYDSLRATLGEGKKFAVQVRNVDFVAGRDCISVTCSGTILSYLKSRVFTQTFVLNPTPYRENAYYVSGETLRYISCSDEEVPANHIVVSQAELDHIKAQAAHVSDVEETEAPVRAAPAPKRAPKEQTEAKPVAERPARKEREPRERKEREPKTDAKAEAKTDATKTEERAPRQPRQTTNKVRIVAVPRVVKFDAIKSDAAEIGSVVSFKPDGKDVVIEFADGKSAGAMARLSKKYKATDKYPGLTIKFEF